MGKPWGRKKIPLDQLLLWEVFLTCALHGHHPAVADLDRHLRTVVLAGLDLLDQADDLHPLRHLAEHDVRPIEVRGRRQRDEELGAIRVRTTVRHREQAGAHVAMLEPLVLEGLAMHALSTSAVPMGEVPALEDELGNDAVDGTAFVVKRLLPDASRALFSRAKGPEVLTREGKFTAIQLDFNASDFAIVDGKGYEASVTVKQ